MNSEGGQRPAVTTEVDAKRRKQNVGLGKRIGSMDSGMCG